MKNGKYELVIAPPDYPGKKYRRRYAYEHHVVWWQTTGELLKPGYVIHHKNDQKRENVSPNLEEKTRSQHTADHNRKGRQYRDLVCSFCGIPFKREKRQCGRGTIRFYCCRAHQMAARQHIPV